MSHVFTLTLDRLHVVAYPDFDYVVLIKPPNPAVTLTIDQLYNLCQTVKRQRKEEDCESR